LTGWRSLPLRTLLAIALPSLDFRKMQFSLLTFSNSNATEKMSVYRVIESVLSAKCCQLPALIGARCQPCMAAIELWPGLAGEYPGFSRMRQ
jgi:hypothetical protein